MATIITYPSALEFWISEKGIPHYIHFDKYSSSVSNKEVFQNVSARDEIIRTIDQLFFSTPVHVAVQSNIRRTSSEKVVFHMLPDSLPEHTFYKIMDNTYIVCPEFCFIQAAAALSISELTLVANNLCAIYVKDEFEEYSQRKRDPVVTTDEIKKYICKTGEIKGIAKARSNISYVSDRSNSPMESRLAVLAALPLSRGGYGVIKPQLNLDIKLTRAAADYLGKDSCCCDMVWKKQKVILEYDSNLSHLGLKQHFRDKRRSTALNIAGFKVISITAEQIGNFGSIETAFLRIRSALGMRTHKDRWEEYIDLRRQVVQNILLRKDQDFERECLHHSPRFLDEIQNEADNLWD